MGIQSPVGNKKFPGSRYPVILALAAAAAIFAGTIGLSGQAPRAQDSAIPVHFTDIRKAAGITFIQDSTQTEEKYYLETMGTGVAWLDYDQDGLMDIFFVQSAA